MHLALSCAFLWGRGDNTAIALLSAPSSQAQPETSRPCFCFQYPQKIPEAEDIYDQCLTQAEIQGSINKVNGEQSNVSGAV